jgi:hypothetical protein
MSTVPFAKAVIAEEDDARGKYRSTTTSDDKNSNDFDHHPTTLLDEYAYVKTGEDAKEFRDVIWMVLFYIHLIAVVIAIMINIRNDNINNINNSDTTTGQEQQQQQQQQQQDEEEAIRGLLLLFVVSSVSSTILSTAALTMMSFCLNAMIKTGLLFSIVMSLVVGLLGFLNQQIWIGVFGIVSFLIGCCYAKLVWNRIPFAEANLRAAIIAVKANWGLTLLAYGTVMTALAWTYFWFLGFGTSIYTSNWGLLFGLLFSFYWVFNVLFNTLVVTSVGTVGTWWVAPNEANSCCSSAVRDSFFRSVTYSFGSICLGSLLVAFIQALRALLASVKNNDDCQLLACILDCLLSCIEGALEYLNKWAYVFVGLYGLNYVEAGRGVFDLFEEKGWSSIISDDLCDRVLALISVGVGLLTGLVALLVTYWDNGLLNTLDLGEYELMIAFFIGLIVGLVFCNILMSVLGAAVNCIIVCFADSPREFEVNHPQLSTEMREAWIMAWPELAFN